MGQNEQYSEMRKKPFDYLHATDYGYVNLTKKPEKTHSKNIVLRGIDMITVNLYYTGQNGDARKFAEEMETSGTADKIRAEKGNVRYEYFFPMNDPETVLLIDAWENQKAIDEHHASPMMKTIANLREKYNLHMKVERYVSETLPSTDDAFIRK